MATLNAAQLDALAADIKHLGRELGFAKLGIAAIDLEADERRLDRWLALGRHGTMRYMERHGRKRTRPAELVPGTIRVISARMSYWPEAAHDARASLADPTKGYVARYALGRDYHKVLRQRLQRLADAIGERIGEFGYRAFVDSAPVLEKALARDAGLGWIGKHTNLLDRDGSWFLLGELYTDLPLPPDSRTTEHCGSCRACLDVCPTQAIVAPYELDARRCISYLTIELRGSIPEPLRAAIGNRIFGCDDCQLFCPWNKFAQPTPVGDFAIRHGLDNSGLIELFSWSEAEWQRRTAGSALRRAGYEGWLRNIAVALGNAPPDAHVVGALEARADNPSALVREHVYWALARQRAAAGGCLGLPTPSLLRIETAPTIVEPEPQISAMSMVNLESLAYGIDTDFRRSLMQGIALFRGIDAESLSDLLPQCGRIDVAQGEVLLSPERENHCVYVVLSGRLSVHLGSLEAPKIADLGPGSCAGEMSLIENKDPSAFVVATENCHLMVISHTLLWRMVDRSHTFCKNLLVVLSERVRSDNEYIATSLGVLRQAERNAHTDALTGLGNRHWMRTMFEREITRALHSKKSLCLMMIDVDNFKVFNDQYGHIAGDRVLVAVADALREYLRPTDLVARFGGDEFAVLLPDVQLKQARQTAERIRQQVAALSPPSLSTAITISIGITDRSDRDDVATLVQRADAAMYEAKEAGRNRVTISPASDE